MSRLLTAIKRGFPSIGTEDLIPVEIPLGLGGLNYSKSMDEAAFPITDLSVAEQITLENDTTRKEGGSAKINTTPITGNPRIMGAFDFITNAGSQFLVAAPGDGKIVTVGAGGIVSTLKTGLGTNRLTVFREGGGGTVKKLFSTNGFNVVQVWDGVAASTSDIATPPADWSGNNQPAGLIIHGGGAGAAGGGRMIGWGNANDPHRLYGSQPGNHENFTTGATAGFSLPVYAGTGQRIAACWSYKGRLIWWKYPGGIGWLDDSATDVTQWFVKLLSAQVGLASPLACVQIDDDILFMGTDGLIYALSGIVEYGDIKNAAIKPNNLIRFVQENINLNVLDRCTAVYYPDKKQAHFCVNQIGTTPVVNNARLIVDMHTPGDPHFIWSTKDVCEAITLRKKSTGAYKPIVGDDSGTIWEIDQDGRDKAGAAYQGKFATREIEFFPGGRQRANLAYCEVVYRPTGNWNFSLDFELDGKYRYTKLFNMGGGPGLVLDSGQLDTGVLGGEILANRIKRITGDCRRIRLVGYQGGAGEEFEIIKIILWISAGSRRK